MFAAILTLLPVILAESLTPEEAIGMEVLLEDIKSYRSEYQSFLAELAGTSSKNFPTKLIQLYTAMTTYTDDSYTTMFSEVDQAEMTTMEGLMQELPWYSSRLLPEIEQDLLSLEAVANATATAPVNATITSNSTLTTPGTSTNSTSSDLASTATLSESSSTESSSESSSSAAGAASAAPEALAVLSAGAGFLAYLLL